MDTAAEVTARMKAMADERQRETLMRFFKTAPGEYGEGDEFLGIRVPQTRSVVAEAADMEMAETEKLIYSPWHEIRLCGLLILAEQMRRLTLRGMTDKPAGMKERERIVRFLSQTRPSGKQLGPCGPLRRKDNGALARHAGCVDGGGKDSRDGPSC